MDTCRYLTTCYFYNNYEGNMPKTAAYIRGNYCNCNYTMCSRFRASQSVGVDKVPKDLFPLGVALRVIRS